MSVNNWHGIGNLTKEVETRFTPNGKEVCNFDIAINEKYGDKESTEYVKIVAWSKLAEVCGKYLRKGSKVYVSGRLQTRSYDDKNGGPKRYITEIIANSMQMLDTKQTSQHGQQRSQQGGGMNQHNSQEPPFNMDEDPIPF